MQIKYGPMFPPEHANFTQEEINDSIDTINMLRGKEETCRCGNKMNKDAKFCSQCGLPRKEALRDDLTADEKSMLLYIKEREEKNTGGVYFISIYDLRHIPFFDTILTRFRSVLQSLAKKGYITFKNDIATLKKPAP